MKAACDPAGIDPGRGLVYESGLFSRMNWQEFSVIMPEGFSALEVLKTMGPSTVIQIVPSYGTGLNHAELQHAIG